MKNKRPSVAFVPITMKLFWQLYPELEEKCTAQQEVVVSNLKKNLNLHEMKLTGDENDAQETTAELKTKEFDLLIVWEHGYVASAIPYKIIKEFKGIPVVIMVTQLDKEIPLDMDYSRYMESTATTSAMELGGVLSRMGCDYSTLVGHMEDEEIYECLYSKALTARVYKEIKSSEVGSIGYGYPGMLDICVDDAEVSKIVQGVRKITLEEIRNELDKVTEKQVSEFKELTNSLFEMNRIEEDDFERAAKTYIALETIIKKYSLSALCVHDYDFLSAVTGAVSDFALSMLENRHGIATGVEGDMPNTISALIGRKFSGQSCMFVDWTMFDEKLNAIFLQHNGKADPDIVDEPSLSPSAEPFGGVVGDGVVVEASGKAGPVTMLGMIYRDGWKIFAAQGNALEMDVRPCRLNQLTVEIDMPVKRFLEKACDLGLGHHLNVARGHWRDEIKELAQLMRITFIEL